MKTKSFALVFSACLLGATLLPAFAGGGSDDNREVVREHREHREGGSRDYRGDDRFQAESYRRGGYYYYSYRPRWNFGFGVWPWWGPRYYVRYYDRIPGEVVHEHPVYWERPVSVGISLELDVQKVLARKGFYHGPLDGNAGPVTRASIRAYQKRHGLDQTGEIDPPLMRSMNLL